ncbi:tRNA uridine-5-carboxymethylaminomethyl(34) synthesis GTPase MnmE [Roseivivax isoporae]|uniref:tRNA modification GTPase MnmE n=1 Tax=Roseivivax isoporae LMG 25204 TaxID=1449351 RepID=X7F7D9_9RHOB|nr:tRNA uridine-5-carboxymethylaminomethyl(34) synthesis GTPase MnmE [Roseivivax isoporae]ETX28720.1 tRNA modification GTPase TrmE [Roseivivax isoporae LMG 25204]
MDTIFALASAAGKAGVAVVRLSGPRSWDSVRALSGTVPEPRRASLRRLIAADGTFLDSALVLTFPEGQSFTGEESAELHLHGSVAIVQAVLRELLSHDGVRHAEPGEFTRRALENGRMDLAQVEALADLIESETEAQRQQALRVFSGALGGKVETWRTRLVRAAALLEAVMDFADEEVPVDVSGEVVELIDHVATDLRQELHGFGSAERVRSGFEVAIVGAPNVGKSTLLNAIAGRQAAITSEIAGTTRDVIEVRMDLSGLAVTLLDTAGLRETGDAVELIGVARARERAAAADVRVFLGGSADGVESREGDLHYGAKADLTGDETGISGVTGQGIDRVLSDLSRVLSERASAAGLVTRERHRAAMQAGLEGLDTARLVVLQGPDEYDIAAEELRAAIRNLDALIGRVGVETLLDEIFSSFCLGK